MAKNENFNSNTNQYKVYEIFNAIYQNEIFFFGKSLKNQEYQGYLIEKNIIVLKN